MKEVGLLEFYEGDIKERSYFIYVLKVKKTVVYVGRSVDIWSRWFGPFGRLTRTRKWFRGSSSLAIMIADNPDWDWKLQLWTIREAARFCKYKFPNDTKPFDFLDRIETEMIYKLKPLENRVKLSNDGVEPPDFIVDYYRKQNDEIASVYDEVYDPHYHRLRCKSAMKK